MVGIRVYRFFSGEGFGQHCLLAIISGLFLILYLLSFANCFIANSICYKSNNYKALAMAIIYRLPHFFPVFSLHAINRSFSSSNQCAFIFDLVSSIGNNGMRGGEFPYGLFTYSFIYTRFTYFHLLWPNITSYFHNKYY